MRGGVVEAIFIGPEKKGAMHAVGSVHAVAGQGLVGDRYLKKDGEEDPGRHVTLIEAEAIEAVVRDEAIPLSPDETRRNVVTRGVALNHLVGRDFHVGGVLLRGIRLCEPCGHLETMTRPGVRLALLHRGGLRAQILADGDLRVGDSVDGS
jgi:MOSC domain-containing protein YiiM